MANDNGYTKRWRKRWQKGYHRDRILWVLMDYLIDHVNWKDEEKFNPRYGMVKMKRGQGIFGRKMLAEKLGVGQRQIRTRLDFLKTIDFLTIRTTNKYSIITISNYEKYQCNDEDERPTERPAGDQQATTPEEVLRSKEIVEKIPYKKIIDYLNLKTASNYKLSTASTKGVIKARWNEGFRLKDFKKVIDTKTDEWATDDRMVRYLRPITLFSNKFESYLNQRKETSTPKPERAYRRD